MDRSGRIWEFKRAPYTSTIDNGNKFTTTIVRSRDPIQVTENNVVIRMLETSVIVDKRSRRILRTMQEEQINYFTPVGQGGMNLQSSVKSFGANGAPMIQETSVRQVTQIAPFQPINTYQGMDTRSMFRDFMIARGYGNLLPDDLAPAPTNAGTNAQAAPIYTAPQDPTPVLAPASTPPQAAGTGSMITDTNAPSVAPPSVPISLQSNPDDTTITGPGAPPVAPSRVP